MCNIQLEEPRLTHTCNGAQEALCEGKMPSLDIGSSAARHSARAILVDLTANFSCSSL